MNLLTIKKEQTLFSLYLKELGVKHTLKYTNKRYNEHPHKYNLFGLSKMLNDYGIDNTGIRVENKDELTKLEAPFIAQSSNDLVLVTKMNSDTINYKWGKLDISTTLDEFKKTWSGIVLLSETSEKSIEPDYHSNRKKELFKLIQQSILIATIALLLILLYTGQRLYNNIGLTMSLTVNLIGVYISYLLVLKQMNIRGSYGDKICSLFKKSDCNDILDSEAAKIGGVVGWSEIGLGYFVSNLLITLTAPQLVSYLAIISACALLYSVWSIWYQKFKAKIWCPLCLIVQAIFLVSFFIYLLFGFFRMPQLLISDILLLGCIYIIPTLAINTFLPTLIESLKIENITYDINNLKANDEIFATLLKKQPRYEVDKSTSKILWGNPDAPILVTILTNPHCNPCARMHKRIETILEKNYKLYCIQYIFSSFNKDLERSSRILINAYLTNNIERSGHIFDEWFSEGKSDPDKFCKKYDLDDTHDETIQEHDEHLAWKSRTGWRATPTIIINGYELPKNYKIEDILYFTDLDVDSK